MRFDAVAFVVVVVVVVSVVSLFPPSRLEYLVQNIYLELLFSYSLELGHMKTSA